MATLKDGLTPTLSLHTQSIGGPGPIAYDENLYPSNALKRKEIEDYVRFRLGDGMVDVELDPEHYKVAIDRALLRYRQRSSAGEEESYAFLDLLPETQEYILPADIMTVRQVFRRGIGSVSGTTASQFEPFASGYLNTYMLVAGRVGGLTNYELFTQYQKLAMNMFGGYMNFTYNPMSKKLTIVRKIPSVGHTYKRLQTLSADGLTAGSTITLTLSEPWGGKGLTVGGTLVIVNCPINGYNNSYEIQSLDGTQQTITVTAQHNLGAASVSHFDLTRTNAYAPETDDPAETVLLWIYNRKPDSMLFNDSRIFPWIQDYALAVSKDMLGQAREKFATIAGPQGGTQLNGAALKGEAKAEMEVLEEELKRFYDGSMPYTWVTG